MKEKISIKYIFSTSLFLSLLIVFFGHYLNPLIEKILNLAGICETYLGDYSCYNWNKAILLAIFSFTISVFLVSILLFSTKQEAYKRWAKFSIYALPIGFIFSLLIAIGAKPKTGGYFDIGSINNLVVFIPSIIFLTISVTILFKQKVNNSNQLI
jgi:hypothetical protein